MLRHLNLATLIACIALTCSLTVLKSFYQYINYEDYLNLMTSISGSRNYQKIFKVEDGFAKYPKELIPMCGSAPCVNPIFEISSFYKGEEYVKTLPTVFFVGTFHGDEVIGANSMYYLIKLIDSHYHKREFLRNLIESVRLILMPIANPNAFKNEKREEFNNGKLIDMNRDFPYDAKKGCLKSPSTRLIDQIFRDNLIIGCLAYHGGSNTISYPWGNKPHSKDPKSADHNSFSLVANALSNAAGENKILAIDSYQTGTLHDIVYDVEGGFEDYAYGASFDKTNINKVCQYKTLDNKNVDIPIEYNSVTHRAFVYLIETSKDKIPKSLMLGSEEETLNENFESVYWGHINRNINLMFGFSQIIGNFARITSITYDQNAIFEIFVYGCLTIDFVSSSEGYARILSQSFNDRTIKWTILLRLDSEKTQFDNLQFTISCDRQYSKDKNPESNFVRLKTGLREEISHNDNKVKKTGDLYVSIEDLDLSIIKNAMILWNGKNHHLIEYNHDAYRLKNLLTLIFFEGKILSRFEKGSYVTIYDKKEDKDSKPPILEFTRNQLIEINSQAFIDLENKYAIIYGIYENDNNRSVTFEGHLEAFIDDLNMNDISIQSVLGKIPNENPKILLLAKSISQRLFEIKIISRQSAIKLFNLLGTNRLESYIERLEVHPSQVVVIKRVYPTGFLNLKKFFESQFQLIDDTGKPYIFHFESNEKNESVESIVKTYFSESEHYVSHKSTLFVFILLLFCLTVILIKFYTSRGNFREALDQAEVTVVQG